MFKKPRDASEECGRFLNELEAALRFERVDNAPGDLLLQMSGTAQEHARLCASCRGALEDLRATRKALQPMAESTPEAGPWFVKRVMAAITAKERALEERREGVWSSVRRLAPRVVALCALLLVLGGSWAWQVRRVELARGQEMRPVETVFDAGQNTPFNEDVLAPAHEGRR